MRPTPGRTAQLLRDVLAAAETLEDTGPVKKQLTAMAAVSKRYFAAQAVLEKAEDALANQMAVVGRADVAQDGGVEHLCTALIEAGEPRARPLAAFSKASPSEVKEMAYEREAKVCLDIVATVRREKAPLIKSLEAACDKLEKASLAVKAEVAKCPPLQAAVTDAVTARDRVGQDAHTALARLRKAAASADADNGTTIVAGLFATGRVVRKAEAAKGKAAKKKAAGGGAGSSGKSGGK